MANKHLGLGTRVRLDESSDWADSDDKYNFDRMNPTNIKGTIILPEHTESWVSVLWDNGDKNCYRGEDSDLIPVE